MLEYPPLNSRWCNQRPQCIPYSVRKAAVRAAGKLRPKTAFWAPMRDERTGIYVFLCLWLYVTLKLSKAVYGFVIGKRMLTVY